MDHAFLRIFWNNFYEISDGVYRANQPSPSHLKSYKRRGIRSVLSLRGRANQSYALFEEDYCEKLDLNLVYTPISSSLAPVAEDLINIIDVIIKRTSFDLSKAREKEHILIGLAIAIENIAFVGGSYILISLSLLIFFRKTICP